MIKTIAVNGAAGRMGIRLVQLISADPELRLTGALESIQHPKLGQDIGMVSSLEHLGVVLSTFEGLSEKPDLVIDFSNPGGADAAIAYGLESGTALVIATTGLENHTIENLRDAAKQIPIVWAPNMSLAVNLTMKLVEMVAQALPANNTDVEIVERHHRLKADSPSGTALKFGDIVARNMGQTEHRHGRVGMVGQRSLKEIGYHAIRTGDNPGEHTIIFGMLGETIELRVAASNRDCYARGAIAAAKFLFGKQAGLYSMADVLGLT
jgi:4-hydroxy-tetrahydrodipicolinate reductase